MGSPSLLFLEVFSFHLVHLTAAAGAASFASIKKVPLLNT